MKFFTEQITTLLPELKQNLTSPWLILLEGDLGAGKTTWTQEFVGALGGVPTDVKSPTFLKLLTHDVPGFGLVLHLDAYRMDDVDEFLRLGLEAYENVKALVIEWPQIFLEFLVKYPEYKSLLGLKNYAKLSFEIDPARSARVVDLEFKNLISR